jgi:curved DNA-binding protein CbpA
VLGFPAGTIKPSKREIMSRYRDGVRRAHPDHGGAEAKASKALQDISEARRVLLEMM